MHSFFVLQPSDDARWMRASIVRAPGASFDGRFEKRLFRGDETPPAGMTCVVSSGVDAPDLLGNARRIPIVSARLADGLRAAKLDGLDFYPVTVEVPSRQPLAYAGLVVRGRAELHVEKSGADFELQTGLRILAPMNVGGLHIEASAWNGGDVFVVPEYPLLPICTEKVAAVLGELRARGLSIVPSEGFKPS